MEESSSEETIEAKTIRNESGVTCRAVPGKMVTKTVSIKGKGTASTAIAAGALSGTVRSVSRKNTEKNNEFPDFEITGKAYLDLPE